MFDSGNVDHTGQIDEIEVMKLVKQLNTGLTTDKIQQKLKVSEAMCKNTRSYL